MQSLIRAHLPADIVLRRDQATDKPPIVVSDTHFLTHTEIRLCFRRLLAHTTLPFYFPQTACQKAFTGHCLFSVLARPRHALADGSRNGGIMSDNIRRCQQTFPPPARCSL